MSEDKNTALGSRAGIGYSHVVPATHHPQSTTLAMITAALVLVALVLLTSWDTAGHEE
jgi:hypothetical protein